MENLIDADDGPLEEDDEDCEHVDCDRIDRDIWCEDCQQVKTGAYECRDCYREFCSDCMPEADDDEEDDEDEDNCDHDHCERERGPYRCDDCGDMMNVYINRCADCGFGFCNDCLPESNEDCSHDDCERERGPYNCDDCGDRMNVYINRCVDCGVGFCSYCLEG